MESCLARERGEQRLEVLINDTLYHEQRRLERENRRDSVVPADLAFYRSVRCTLSRADAGELVPLVTSLGSLRSALREHMQIQGAVDQVRALMSRGTLVVVPTHSSHLDSIALGYAVYLLGMPPLLYRARLNLFKNAAGRSIP